jgi:hypothetical protein
MSKRKNLRKLICLFCVTINIYFCNTTMLQNATADEWCDLGISVTTDSAQHDAFLGHTTQWDQIIVGLTKDVPVSNEYKAGNWSLDIKKIKIEHKYRKNDIFQAKPVPTIERPAELICQQKVIDQNTHIQKIQFAPEKAGYTQETYRIVITVPKLLKSNNQQAKNANGKGLFWRSYKDISITYAVPEFKLVAVRFTSDHGMLRPNTYNTKPDFYNIGNAKTYKELYPDGTLQWNWTRNVSGTLMETLTASYPITHTWKLADPNVTIKYTVRLKNFGATIKGNIYFGQSTRPNNTSPSFIPPSEGNTTDIDFYVLNNCDTIGITNLVQELIVRYETNDVILLTKEFIQIIYYTFGTPQIEINEARIRLATNLIFANIRSTDIIEAIKNKLLIAPYRLFGSNNIASKYMNNNPEIHYWNRREEGGIDCISHAEFYKRVCQAIGMPASFGVLTLIADYATIGDPDLPKKATNGVFGWPDIKRHHLYDGIMNYVTPPKGLAKYAADAVVYTSLSRKIKNMGEDRTNGALIFYAGGEGNNYVAVLTIRISDNKVYYLAGGTKDIFEYRDQAVYMVMDTLEWLFYKFEELPTGNPEQPTSLYPIQTNERVLDYDYQQQRQQQQQF